MGAAAEAVLIEDMPGVGKTTVAVAAARALGFSFGRVQCTNDLLPSDITGLNIFKPEKSEFEFRPGPIFNNLVLVDEINRATPKTQSALLEAMGEGQATIDGETRKMPDPFIAIATQNPTEHAGTFPLPESQMDRFMMRVSMGYPDRAAEMEILSLGSQRRQVDELRPIMSAAEVASIRRILDKEIKVSEKITGYILNIAERTRTHSLIAAGVSTRGAMILMNCARRVAWMRGRAFVVPEDVKLFANAVLAHRIQMKGGAASEAADVMDEILRDTPAL
ncbi:ATPase AAA [Synergistales bacterium]|nr:ATPase AAA [Synergistales bacterium]